MSATVYGRQPMGAAECGLAGQYPFPALGLAMPGGLAFHDDFIAGPGTIVASRYGDQLWSASAFTTGLTYAGVAATGYASGPGALQGTSAASVNTGGVVFSGYLPFWGFPPPGAIWATRIRLTSGTSGYELWSGFASAASRVRVADATRFCGVRVEGSGNLFGVSKNGATAANETTIDLGVTAQGSNWVTVGFEVGGTVAAPSIQFFVLDRLGANRQVWDRTDVGAPITTTLSSGPALPVAFGLVTQDAVAKIAQIDHWGIGGRIARA